METLGNNLVAFSGKEVKNKYHCEKCDYTCFKKYNWDKHLVTLKHSKETTGNNLVAFSGKNELLCEICNKEFKNRSGLWKHNKKNHEQNNTNTNNVIDKEVVMMLLKQNSDIIKETFDLKSIVLEIVKNGTTNTNHSHNTTHTNSHNKTFNLNFFLNETCKNAMNIEEFVDQIVLNLHDLEETARLGFAEGVSKMIMKRLNALDITERPIHCSDLKRETLYIKNENKWEKEEDSKPKLTKAVKKIAGKNMKQIFEWQKVHPDYSDPDSKENDKYMKMLTHVMSGGTIEETNTNYEKVVRNITKETTIDKEQFAV
jgi:hypothetical protein